MEKIDDRDSSIVFSKPLSGQDWSHLGGPQNTTSLTQTKDANAKLTFYGTSIAVYGTVTVDSADSGTTSEYIVDGGKGATYTTSPTKETQHQVKFFQSATLSPGKHTLEVINETEGGWLLLDFFLVANSTNDFPSSTNLMSRTLSSHSTSTIAVASIPTPTIDTGSSVVYSSSTSNHKGPNTGVIIGSVLVGAIGLIILVAITCFIRRRLAGRYVDEATAIPTDAPAPASSSKAVQSFALAHQSHNSRTNAGYDISVKAGGVVQVHHQHQQPYQRHNRHGSNASASSNYPSSRSVVGIAQQAYHSNATNVRRGQEPAPPYFNTPQPLSHGRQYPTSSSHLGTPSLSHSHSLGTGDLSIFECNPPRDGQETDFIARKPDSALIVNEEVGYGYDSQRDSGITSRSFSRDASLLVYPEIPPGLSGPRI